jgi:hypothetical protein
MVGPAFFHERDEKGAGFLGCFEVQGVECPGVGVGLDGGGGGEDEDVVLEWRWWWSSPGIRIDAWGTRFIACGTRLLRRSYSHLRDDETVAKMGHPVLRRFDRFACGEGGLSSWFDYADDWDLQGLLDIFESEGGGGVASDDQEFSSFVVEKFCAFYSVAGDGLAGFGAVGETGGVAEVDVVGSRDEWEQGAEDGEAAEA